MDNDQLELSEIIECLEALISIGWNKGLNIRYGCESDITRTQRGLDVRFLCDRLDAFGVDFSVQNKALQYINECEASETWQLFYRHSFKKLAIECAAGIE